ncbi:MAG TPA: dTDP-4-dehydrorhamnose 3,5-epimerase [Chthoniobacterales bacterium]
MIFRETALQGAYIVDLDQKSDERGFFGRAFCAREFEQHGLNPRMVQANLSFNHARGTLRGMHYQALPAAESKLIRCVHGAIWDVIVDMRPESPTYLEYIGVELSADNHRAIYVPELFAHGNQALTDGAELLYLISEFYAPGMERGVRYDDPAIGIEWPLPVTVISEKDKSWPFLKEVTSDDRRAALR